MLEFLKSRWDACSLATRWALVAVLVIAVNAWLGALLAVAAAWLHESPHNAAPRTDWLPLWWNVPVAMALITLSYGKALPTDDLLRHLSSWQLNFDYRAQYPWSDLPRADLWFGFDYLLGQLQRGGVTPQALLQWLPGVGVLLNAWVLYGSLRSSAPKHRLHNGLFLMVGALGLLLTTPRMLLGRPEAFLAALGGAVWLCRTRKQSLVWILAFLAAIPVYWLGWVYAPFALLLPLYDWRRRLALVAGLMLVHLAYWQVYTGDYLGLLWWLRGTLTVLAAENAPMLRNLAGWTSWVFFALVGWSLAQRGRPRGSQPVRWKKILRLAPIGVLLVWFSLPNQVRYQPALAFALLPWVLKTLNSTASTRHARGAPWRINPILVAIALAVAGLQQVSRTEALPAFALGAKARVYSEQPYATVFYGEPGIAVEPSFALGATKPEWRGLLAKGSFDCRRAQLAGFTHLVEKSLTVIPPCASLQGVQGVWRLWTIQQDTKK